MQGPKIWKESLAILSLDSVFSSIGGYMHLVILFFSQLTIYMNYFNMNMSFIKQMYSTDGRDQAGEADVNGDPKGLVERRLQNRKPFLWSFRGYLSAKFLRCCCCCFKSRKCFKRRNKTLVRFYELRERLNHEIDILEIARILRETRLISQVVLHKLTR